MTEEEAMLRFRTEILEALAEDAAERPGLPAPARRGPEPTDLVDGAFTFEKWDSPWTGRRYVPRSGEDPRWRWSMREAKRGEAEFEPLPDPDDVR